MEASAAAPTWARSPSDDIAESASFLIDAEGRVAWLRVAANYRVRPRPEEILAAADKL